MQTEPNVWAFFVGGPLNGKRHRYPGTPLYRVLEPRAAITPNLNGQTTPPTLGAATYRLEMLRVGGNEYPVYVLESISLADAERSLTAAHGAHKNTLDTCPLCVGYAAAGRRKL